MSSSTMYDTITLDNLDTLNTLTYDPAIIGPLTSHNYGVGASGSSGTYGVSTGGSFFTTNSTSPWQNLTMTNNHQSSMQVQGDAVFEGKVKINGKDLGEFMEIISKRLAILVPDPAKLEHFEALKKAYDHYKMLEQLCELPKEDDEQS